MSIVFVRHGHVAYVPGRCVGHTDVPLSALGHAEFGRLAENWADRPAEVWTSDLSRASISAERLAARWGIRPIVDSRLRELHFGAWEGSAWDALQERDGTRVAEWAADWVNRRPPGGESFQDLVRRVEAWMAEVRSRAVAGEVVAVAHAGTIRAALCVAGRLKPQRAFEVAIGYAEIVRLEPGSY